MRVHGFLIFNGRKRGTLHKQSVCQEIWNPSACIHCDDPYDYYGSPVMYTRKDAKIKNINVNLIRKPIYLYLYCPSVNFFNRC